MTNPLFRNVGLLLGRVALGVIFLAHGLQKLNTWGHAGTSAAFDSMGVPAADLTAFLVTWLEIFGGIALIIGLLTPIFAALLAIDMIGALFITHVDNGLWASDGGYEMVLALAAASVMLAVVGAGKFSADGVLGKKIPLLATA